MFINSIRVTFYWRRLTPRDAVHYSAKRVN